MNLPLAEAINLYRECFAVYSDEAETILSYAERYGRICPIEQDGKTAGMICLTRISDGEFEAEYIFAACVTPEHREKGLFRKNLETLIGEKPSLLIPENESLFPMYEKLGYKPIYCLEADIEGENTAVDFGGTVDELYEIYKSSFQFPKKDIALFKAVIGAHLAYGGKIKRLGDCIALIFQGNAVDIFAPTAKNALRMANSLYGRYKAIFPLECEAVLRGAGAIFGKKRIAMAKNIPQTNIYINTLFN